MAAVWSAVETIRRKRDGLPLEREEIEALVESHVAGRIPDYQVSALLMAIYFRGLDEREMTDLTMAMAHSGDMVDFGEDSRIVDKHSTGGVGDKTSLVAVPLVAAAGAVVAKMSGRGLGYSGGTIDKLESIPGFRVTLEPAEFRRQTAELGAAIVGQSGNLVPADKLIYALRDVTATVESVGLIASSIMSKKIAGGARRLVLDVKTGRGAFMRDRGQALELARAMVAIGRKAGLKTVAVVSNMDQPLGLAVGNALEVAEAVACLKGEGPADLEELCLVLGAYMLVLAGVAPEVGMARERLKRVLRSGEALERLRRLVVAQGGDGRVVDRPWEVLPAAPARIEARASARGYVRGIDTPEVGRLVMRLGAGRVRKEDPVDPSVGVVLRAKTGDWLERGDVLGTVHGRSEAEAREAAGCLEAAYEMSEEPEPLPELIVGTVE